MVSETMLMGNGVVVTGGSDSQVIAGGGVVWRGERIVAVGAEADLVVEFSDAHRLDAGGGLIMPGLVNLHHHFYSALARGLDPGVEMRNFPEVLDRLWWRLDRALDPDCVRISALLSVADCVRWGCTTVFDHHASPGCIHGSLDLIADAVETAGISGLLCYEVTDRNGREGMMAGIEENLRFLEERKADGRLRGVLGLHASFTVSDETLEMVAARRPADGGCHVHVAEDPMDVSASQEAFGLAPVQRLQRYGLLDERALLAHTIHLQEEDYRILAEAGCTLIHNPESNANNGVGRLDVPRVTALGCAVGLGTDGMASAMLRALRAAFLTLRGETRDPTLGFNALPGLLATNVRVARRFFGEPLLGELSPGAPADVIAVDSVPPTPLGGQNLFGHLVYGASEAPVRHTVARGRILLEDFRHTTLDTQELAAKARALAPSLWARFHSLEWGTNFLGAEAD